MVHKISITLAILSFIWPKSNSILTSPFSFIVVLIEISGSTYGEIKKESNSGSLKSSLSS